MAVTGPSAPGSGAAFRHEALLYAGPDDFVARVGPFIRDGLTVDEPVLVVVVGGKIELLRSELGAAAEQVRFIDMAKVGRNPGRIIPEWQAFVDEYAGSGRRLRGIGEPIWPDRTPDELVECERHEALLNVAFADAPTWWLVCPYDTSNLDPAVLKEAERNHPLVLDGRSHRESSRFRGLAEGVEPFDHPLPEPNVAPDEMSFGVGQLDALRTFTAHHAARFGLARRSADLVLAVDEVATNSLLHGGGNGVLRIWENENALVCEIRDRGRIDDPLAGRRRPGPDRMSGFGLYAVNQLCDLVQVRSFDSGSVVRLYMSRT